jgi:hypothetical protein
MARLYGRGVDDGLAHGAYRFWFVCRRYLADRFHCIGYFWAQAPKSLFKVYL